MSIEGNIPHAKHAAQAVLYSEFGQNCTSGAGT